MAVKVYIPEKLDVERLIEKRPPDSVPDFKKDELLYILGQVTHIQAYGGDKVSVDGKVPIHAQTIQRKVRHYDKYLNYLIDAGVLQCEPYYTPKYASKAYWFSHRYMCRTKEVLLTDEKLIKKLSKTPPENDTAKDKHKNLWNWWKRGKLNIDREGALEWLSNMYPENPPPPEDEFDLMDRRTENMVKYNAHSLTVEHLYDKERELFFKLDDVAGRLHTPLTNLKKELRNFVTYGGAPLACIDIKNCQPYLSLLFFNPNFYKFNLKKGVSAADKKFINSLVNDIGVNGIDVNDIGVKDIVEGRFNVSSICSNVNVLSLNNISFYSSGYMSFFQCLSSMSSLIMLVKDIVREGEKGLYSDVEQYFRDISGGTFYDNLRDNYNREIGGNHTRGDIKKLYCMVAYGEVYGINHPATHPFYRFFAKQYPTVMKFYNLLKAEDYKNMVYLLQRIEAHVMLNVICKTIAGKKPGVPIYTIHDSIVTTVANVDFVKEVMEQELYRMVGVQPCLDVEFWIPEAVLTTL